MFKSKKKTIFISMIIIAILSTGAFVSVKYGKSLLGIDSKKEYVSFCNGSVKKSMAISRQKAYDSCHCSYNNLLNVMGSERMDKFVRVVLKNDSDKINEFLRKEKMNVAEVDSAFLVCFR